MHYLTPYEQDQVSIEARYQWERYRTHRNDDFHIRIIEQIDRMVENINISLRKTRCIRYRSITNKQNISKLLRRDYSDRRAT